MTLTRYFLILLMALALSPASAQKKPLKRKDSFFGLHFDFHATQSDHEIGQTLSEGMIDSLLTIVKPDFIQVDCKGHPGISSYPTRVGTQAGIVKDPLRLWREATRRHGVALYVHYSGVYDVRSIQLHPDWAVINADGKPDLNTNSVHSAYARELLIPQLKELSQDYGIDGAWIDGDCWATRPDYGPAATKAFTKATGIKDLPLSRADSNYAKFLSFGRTSFLNYVQEYARAIHEFNPDFQVASNWAFTSFMPQPVSVDVDFISGDLTPNNSVNNAAFEGRCIAPQAAMFHKPWDIMSWGFSMNWEKNQLQTQKSVLQLCQEAAEIIAVGGGFQCYFTQNRDASIKTWQIPVMKGLSDFLRPRQTFCKGARPLPQVALLFSGAAHYKNSESLFSSGGLDGIRGITTALLDNQYSVEVLMEHHLHGRMQQYPLIVIPEWDYLEDSFRKELLAYVNEGGHLLLIGPAACKLFSEETGISFSPLPGHSFHFLGFGASMAAMEGVVQTVKLPDGADTIGGIYEEQDFTKGAMPAAATVRIGKGLISAVLMDMGSNYLNNQSSLQRDFLGFILKKIFPDPMVEIRGSHLVHVVINQLNNQTVIHFINTGGPHANRNVYAYDELPLTPALSVKIRVPPRKSVRLQPGGQSLPYSWSKGKLSFRLSPFQVHSMVVIE